MGRTAALVVAALAVGCGSDLVSPRAPGGEATEPSRPGATVERGVAVRSLHAVLGVPVDADESDDVLLDETDFLVSYNPRLRGPNWVEWRLTMADLGHVRRRNAFHADEGLPAGLYRVTTHDYSHSTYDRGHLCPFGDRNGSPEAALQTFLMTNMEPQLHELNAGPWEKLEEYERTEVHRRDSVLYIVAGGVFDRDPPRIGHDVAVPRASFKIIVLLAAGEGAAQVNDATRTLAVEMPNEEGVGRRRWQDFVTSIDRVEADTGYDFLNAVPAGVQAVLEARAPDEL
ncbi:MAG TPA: DNA/RNA non-specific endonuclease [Polyangiaceae bacterium]|nr:DNA/RNA non-specific endonuclease [Polyangiaceae bacterium]